MEKILRLDDIIEWGRSGGFNVMEQNPTSPLGGLSHGIVVYFNGMGVPEGIPPLLWGQKNCVSIKKHIDFDLISSDDKVMESYHTVIYVNRPDYKAFVFIDNQWFIHYLETDIDLPYMEFNELLQASDNIELTVENGKLGGHINSIDLSDYSKMLDKPVSVLMPIPSDSDRTREFLRQENIEVTAIDANTLGVTYGFVKVMGTTMEKRYYTFTYPLVGLKSDAMVENAICKLKRLFLDNKVVIHYNSKYQITKITFK